MKKNYMKGYKPVNQTDENVEDLAKRTWDEIGYKVKCLKAKSFVRVDPPSDVTESGLVLPDKMAKFWAKMGHLRIVTATVLVPAPNSEMKVGDRIAFKRLYLTVWGPMADGGYCGWVEEYQVAGYVTDPNFAGVIDGVNLRPAIERV